MKGATHIPGGLADVGITGLTADSRRVEPGYLFAALPGTIAGSGSDGRAYIADAVARGALVVLAPTGTDLAIPGPGARALDRAALSRVRLVTDDNPRRRLTLLAARFHAPQPKTVVAVTGTNGKSSVVGFTRQIWRSLGHKSGSIGTLGIDADGVVAGPSLTTPDPVALHRTLAELAHAGVQHVALEASSHGLAQYRLDGVVLHAAAFTNITRDHLDYHGDQASYLAAKLRLFSELLPADGVAVLNGDIPEFEQIRDVCRDAGHEVRVFGRMTHDIRLDDAQPLAEGQRLCIACRDRAYETRLPLIGAFQAYNALAALGLVLACDADQDAAIAALAHLRGVRGRMELVARSAAGAPVYIDYAHTPDALETALKAIRPHVRGRLVVVFGAGGDRDSGKRPLMGVVAARAADRIIVTDDNPRREDPESIRRQVLVGCPRAQEIGDRAEAIATAVGLLGPDDVLIVAGKGHEEGQIVGNRTLPFDDREVARAAAVDQGGEVAP
jgi:UDP-N-acetylmuramoyl-L-alanyl-D-glutamate--2,6-diaminopimelate ligase